MAYVSLNNNNKYIFDQDFVILSYAGAAGKNCGFWGCGNSVKEVEGSEYRLAGENEKHGTIGFFNAFDTLSWRSESDGKSFQCTIHWLSELEGPLDTSVNAWGLLFLFFLVLLTIVWLLQKIFMVLPLELKLQRKSIKKASILQSVEILISRHGLEPSMISMGFATWCYSKTQASRMVSE